MANSITSEPARSVGPENGSQVVRKVSHALDLLPKPNQPNWFVRTFRAVFGYRKTTLTFLVLVTLVATVLLSYIDNSLEYSVTLPSSKHEKEYLNYSWLVLQEIGRNEHTYTSKHNDEVHDYLEQEIKLLVKGVKYAEYDNDLNYTNNIMFPVHYLNYDSVSYYESNNLLVRINGSDASLPALLLSSHFDSVPTSYGITDDGMGVASMMGVLLQLCSEGTQPKRTVIFNFNNNEEFGLYGARAFLAHPWAKQVKYFLNLEGTGAGGKAVLFRGTDYGIVNHFLAVRYPYANSFFQQGFNNGMIGSETDYAVYKELGELRGLDLAFFKPRDIYHTAGDNIKNVNRKSLWHMLSATIDFTKHISEAKIDLDGAESEHSRDFASYFSFMNYFFSAPILQIVVVNIVFLVLVPIVLLFLLTIVIHYKKGWDANLVNVVKFPLSFLFSVSLLSFGTDVLLVPYSPFIANNSVELLILTLFSIFMLLNYCFLNLFNLVFKPFKGHQHDEKLVLLLECTLLSWIVVLWSTIKLSNNHIGDDHTGETLAVIIFGAQAVASTLGLIGWSFQKSKRSKSSIRINGEYLPLLGSSSSAQYGTHDGNSLEDCSSLSLASDDEECTMEHKKSFSYDWLLQFVVVVPISSFVIYNWGYLVIDGLHKSIQESRVLQGMIYKFIEMFVVAWTLPFIPFVFKLNRSIVFIFITFAVSGLLILGTRAPFDAANPLKLRFLQTLELTSNSVRNVVTVSARLSSLVTDVLSDMPSVRSEKQKIQEESVGHGMLIYSWNSTLLPHVIPGVGSINDYLHLEVLKNSSTSSDAPFGLLTGELRITAPKNRNCKLSFKTSESSVKISASDKEDYSPVKTAIIYNSKKTSNETYVVAGGIPEGFSKDHNGNYLFKSTSGIKELQLNKLDWDVPYHLSMQWIPEIVDSGAGALSKISVRKLGIQVECYWSELGAVADGRKNDFSVFESIPAYQEVLHYSPSYISWANRDRGMVSVKQYIEI